jgi:ABC-2 type transport system ATP-binding protein
MNFPSPSSASAVIAVENLSRRFGARLALDQVSLYVPRGCVFGLVGENGAGKTTLIKHILGLLKPEAGTVRVFERDPVADSVGVLTRVGYLSEHRDLPAWMRIDQLLRYTQAFYPAWDEHYAEQLREQFGLDPAARIKTLSQGQQAKAGLLLALAFRPELLLLDEPSTGLDPVVRRDILEAIIRTVAEEGRTVFFSSHLLDEIERVSDQVAMLERGRVVLCGTLDSIKSAHHRFTLRFDQPQTAAPVMRTTLSTAGSGKEWSVLCNGNRAEFAVEAEGLGARIVSEEIPSLHEIFVARAGQKEQA